jgi:hypothetical protein
MREIIGTLPPDTFSSKEKRCRASLDEAVMVLPPRQRALLERIAFTKVCGNDISPTGEGIGNECTELTEEEILETVSEDCRRNRICSFIDATGNNAMATSTCAVCAGTFFALEIDVVKVSDLHEKNKVFPSKPHPAHQLTDGMLL